MTTLHHAARAGDLSELRRLIDQGGEIEDYDEKTGHTPLMAACLSPDAGVEVVEFLLAQGANVHARVREKPDSLDLALEDVNATLGELDSETRLELDAEMARMLDEMGASPEIREVIESTRQIGSNPSATPPEAPPLIALAVAKSSCEKIRLLIEHGADLHYRSSHGYNLLTTAACPGREDVIDLLLDAGAPVDGQSVHRESALSVLSRVARFAAVGKILAHGADPYPEDVFPPTDFHSATMVGGWIYLIGNLGYPETRESFELETPVFRLHAGTWKIERVITTGATPGWVHRHAPRLQAGTIHISGGKVLTLDETGKTHIDDHLQSWSFDPATARWQRLDS